MVEAKEKTGKAKAKSKSKAKVESKAKSKSKVASKSKAKSKAKVESKAKSKSKVASKSKAKVESKAKASKSKAKSKAKIASKSKAKSKAKIVAKGKIKIPEAKILDENTRTNAEKILAPLHDVRSIYSPEYIIVGNFSLFNEESYNKGWLHLQVSDVKNILRKSETSKGYSSLELAFFDHISDDYIGEDEYNRLTKIEKELTKMIKNPLESEYVKDAFNTIMSSETLEIRDFRSQIICFKNSNRGMGNIQMIMNYLSETMGHVTFKSPMAMHTFNAYMKDDDDEERPGAYFSHNVIFLAYNPLKLLQVF